MENNRTVYSPKTKADHYDLMTHLGNEGVRWRCTRNLPISSNFGDTGKLYIVEVDELTFVNNTPEDRRAIGVTNKDITIWSNCPTLEDLFGWKEDEVYESTNLLYKISGEEAFYKRKHSEDEWTSDIKLLMRYEELKELKKYEPKYHIWSPYFSNRGYQFLAKNGQSMYWENGLVNKDLQLFTKKDAEVLVDNYRLDHIVCITETR